MSYQDKTLTCRDCGQTFTFSAGEQEFYAQRGLTNEPGRCPDCRAQSRQRRESRPSSAGGGNARGGYDRGAQPRREMYTATCANCGKPAQVPFVPRGDRPVYCSDCFSQMRGR
jgi:CxxC-x17-CxxC domain-containing protein